MRRGGHRHCGCSPINAGNPTCAPWWPRCRVAWPEWCSAMMARRIAANWLCGWRASAASADWPWWWPATGGWRHVAMPACTCGPDAPRWHRPDWPGSAPRRMARRRSCGRAPQESPSSSFPRYSPPQAILARAAWAPRDGHRWLGWRQSGRRLWAASMAIACAAWPVAASPWARSRRSREGCEMFVAVMSHCFANTMRSHCRRLRYREPQGHSRSQVRQHPPTPHDRPCE